jgi:PEGA domain-containing protein
VPKAARMIRAGMAVALLLSTSCATTVSGRSQKIAIWSKPAGATVIVDQVPQGKTPLELKLKRKKTHLVRIEHEGYRPSETLLEHETNDWIWANFLICCGLIGIGVDAMTGGFYKLDPPEIYAVLKETKPPGDGQSHH